MKECISSTIKSFAIKIAMPWIKNFDFYFEKLDNESMEKVIEDFRKGETIYLPSDNSDKKAINKKDLSPQDFSTIIHIMEKMKNKQKSKKPGFIYDSETHKYKKLM